MQIFLSSLHPTLTPTLTAISTSLSTNLQSVIHPVFCRFFSFFPPLLQTACCSHCGWCVGVHSHIGFSSLIIRVCEAAYCVRFMCEQISLSAGAHGSVEAAESNWVCWSLGEHLSLLCSPASSPWGNGEATSHITTRGLGRFVNKMRSVTFVPAVLMFLCGLHSECVALLHP